MIEEIITKFTELSREEQEFICDLIEMYLSQH